MRGRRRNPVPAIGLVIALILPILLNLFIPSRSHAMTGRLVASVQGSNFGGIPPSLIIAGQDRAESILLGAIAIASGQVVVDDLPPGSYRISLDQGGAPGDRAHGFEIGIFAGRTTAVRLDLAKSRVVVEPFAPDPFGFVDGWTGGDLEPLPGSGNDAARFHSTTPIQPRQFMLDGLDLTGSGFRHRTRLEGESIARAVEIPIGPAPASFEEPTLRVASRREASYGDVQVQMGERGRTSWEGTFTRNFPDAPGDLRVFGSYRGIQELDAAPSALESNRLPHNGREGIELYTRIDGRISNATRLTALLYGEGTIRKYFLESYRLNPGHSPMEERAALQGALRATHDRSPRVRLLGEIAVQRTFLESGDGVFFDNLLGYRQLGDPGAGEDGLYWQDGHVYDYFRRKVQVEITGRIEAWRDPGTARAAGAGLLIRRGTYRSYEHLRPTLAFDTGFNHAQSIGYSPNGEERSDEDGRDPGHPWTIGAFLTARRAVAGGEAEIGARLTHFRPGQKALADLSDPFGENETIDDADLTDGTTSTTVDPRVAFTRAIGTRIRFWLAAAGETWIPPSEALYYSSTFLASRAIAINESESLDLVFGNPNLEPERAWIGSAAVGIEPLPRLWVRAGITGRRVDNAISPRAYPVESDSLVYYVNDRARDLIDLAVRGQWTPSRHLQLRASYDLSEARTETIEPRQLEAIWLDEDLPTRGDDMREGQILTFPPHGDGFDRGSFPSAYDERHRISGALVLRTPPELEVGLAVRATSGRPFTYVTLYATGSLEELSDPMENASGVTINQGRTDWMAQLDVRVGKRIRIFGIDTEAWLEIQNITDRRNEIRVYQATGDALDDGWLARQGANDPEAFAKAYETRIRDPYHFATPRLVYGGLRLRFP